MMDFYRALVARHGIPHMGFGGAVGDYISNQANGLVDMNGPTAGMGGPIKLGGGLDGGAKVGTGNLNMGNLGGKIASGWQNMIHPASNTSQFTPNMPMNSFQASAPELMSADYGNGMQMGTSGVQTAYNNLAPVYGAQMGNAGAALGTVPQYQNLYGQQQGLADALLAQSRGQGPNPAQLQFQQNTDQNIKQMSGALASQRGMNPALAAHMAAQQGAAMQQQAAGQSALLGAQQQLAAQGQLGATFGQMGNTLGGQNNVYNTAGGLYGGAANTAGTVGQLGNQIYGTSMQGLGQHNAAVNQGSLGAQGINAGVASGNQAAGVAGQEILGKQSIANAANQAKMNQGLLGGAMQGIGGIFGKAIGPALGGALGGGGEGSGSFGADVASDSGGAASGAGSATGDAADWGQGVANVAHGGEIPDRQALSLAHALMGRGGNVPGKAKVQGDAAKNDTVPTVLSPKEIVIPRSIAMAEDAPQKAAEFVAKLKGKESNKSGAKGYGKILEKHRHLKKKMAELDEMVRKHA